MLKQGLYPRDMTDPMSHTPRQRLYDRALRGRWHLFPVSPETYYQRLSNGLGEGFRAKGQTFKLASRLEAAIERLDRTTAKSAPNDSPPTARSLPGAIRRWSAAMTAKA